MDNFQACSSNIFKISVLFLLFPTIVLGECTCDEEATESNRSVALMYKLSAITSILACGAVGVSLPLFLGKKVPTLSPEKNIFFIIKAFVAGVILATGFIHILPDAFDNLTSPCLGENPWGRFPFPGFVAMMSSIGTLMVDSFATGYYKRLLLDEPAVQLNADAERVDEHAAYVHGHSHGSAQELASSSDLIRHRIISRLEIVVHSVIIGISLGASQSPETIKLLIAALSFHQLFEGMGLGGCISQKMVFLMVVPAKFKARSVATMALFFSLTTPVGIAIGIGVWNVYKKNSPTALIVGGIFNSASAGILIYMALVDLLAADFMNLKMQSNVKLLLGAYISLLSGAGCMSVLAKWA